MEEIIKQISRTNAVLLDAKVVEWLHMHLGKPFDGMSDRDIVLWAKNHGYSMEYKISPARTLIRLVIVWASLRIIR